MKALKVFYQKTGNKISYEYIAFADFNDSIQDAKTWFPYVLPSL